jgi:hypothetical protein
MKYENSCFFSLVLFCSLVKMTIKKLVENKRDTKKKNHIANIQKVLYDEPVTEAGESIAS